MSLASFFCKIQSFGLSPKRRLSIHHNVDVHPCRSKRSRPFPAARSGAIAQYGGCFAVLLLGLRYTFAEQQLLLLLPRVEDCPFCVSRESWKPERRVCTLEVDSISFLVCACRLVSLLCGAGAVWESACIICLRARIAVFGTRSGSFGWVFD